MSWAAKQAMMNVQMRKDKKDIEEAASKKGLYGSIGSTLGTLAALALMPTGVGALAAGAYAGLGSLAGGVVGAEGLTSAKNKNILSGKHEDTVFLKDDAKQMKKMLGDDLIKSALQTGVTTAFSAATDTLDFKKPADQAGAGGEIGKNFTDKINKLLDSIELPDRRSSFRPGID
tara:strand:- start:4708 stop:5229 length:522 start_codon:yes stop_codon:yes gene_type:complete